MCTKQIEGWDFSRRELLYERINRKDARSELKMFAIGYP